MLKPVITATALLALAGGSNVYASRVSATFGSVSPPALERRLIASPRLRTRHRSGSI